MAKGTNHLQLELNTEETKQYVMHLNYRGRRYMDSTASRAMGQCGINEIQVVVRWIRLHLQLRVGFVCIIL